MTERILLKDDLKFQDIENYIKNGGYEALKKALDSKGKEIIDEVKKSGLLGRGGAGFPTGKKWEFVYNVEEKEKYVVANADESEPGTFKDRILIERNPHLILEGMIIAGYAVGAAKGYVFIRGEFYKQQAVFEKAIKDAYEKGFLGKNILGKNFSFDVKIYKGAGAYMSGEETALLESIEGKRACARGKPPYPAIEGLFGKPTLINNVETLANIPAIVKNGGEWYSDLGIEGSGVKLYALSGHVRKPGVYELPIGIKLRDLIEQYGGGAIGKIKCVFPGSITSVPITDLDVKLDYASLNKAGTMLGSGAVIVVNDEVSAVDLALNIIDFFYEESCGFCVPCRQGTKKAKRILENIKEGIATEKDLEILYELKEVMFLTSNCGLGQFSLCAVTGLIDKFKEEFLCK